MSITSVDDSIIDKYLDKLLSQSIKSIKCKSSFDTFYKKKTKNIKSNMSNKIIISNLDNNSNIYFSLLDIIYDYNLD